MSGMDDREREIRQKLKDDLPHYASRCLTIKPKAGKLCRLSLNRTQHFLHDRLEEQRRKTGKVRALVLKGRQPGISTYVGARFYHRVTHHEGLGVFILTHEQKATDNLFAMVQRYHEHCPELVRPSTGTANAKELNFDRLDGGYQVATAGAKATGRSRTIQLFHGSEVAFWPFAEDHAAGVIQAVPDLPDTEIILESTANGIGNYFHKQWQLAEAGKSEFVAVFIPWYWHEEYRSPVPEGWTASEEEREYADAYGLDDEQLVWRRNKIASLGEDWLFKQEYPANAQEAFQTSGDESYIKPQAIMRARKATAEPYGSKVGGLDVARYGDDSSALYIRQGRVAHRYGRWQKKSNMEIAAFAIQAIEEEGLDRLFIDVGGGAGVVDRLEELGYGDRIEAVNFGESALDPDRYSNRRAEMWGECKGWLGEQPAQIPDDDVLHGDLAGPTYTYDSNQRLRLEKKDDMKKRGLRSPDDGDALVLTFAAPVVARKPVGRKRRARSGSGGWMGA